MATYSILKENRREQQIKEKKKSKKCLHAVSNELPFQNLYSTKVFKIRQKGLKKKRKKHQPKTCALYFSYLSALHIISRISFCASPAERKCKRLSVSRTTGISKINGFYCLITRI